MFKENQVLFPQEEDLQSLLEIEETTKYHFKVDASVLLFPYTEETVWVEDIEDELPFLPADDANSCRWLVDKCISNKWMINVNDDGTDGYAYMPNLDIGPILKFVLQHEWPEVQSLAKINTSGTSDYITMDAADLVEIEVEFDFFKPMTFKELVNILGSVNSDFVGVDGDGINKFSEVDVVEVIE